MRFRGRSIRFPRVISSLAMLGISTIVISSAMAFFPEWKSGVDWAEPAVVSPGEGTQPPSDAIVLFSGGDLSAWNGVENWTVEEDYAIVGSNVSTKQGFGDCQLHLEFATPAEVKGTGQERGNSGVYLMGRYEVQVLDSYDNTTYFDGQCAAVYKQRPPLVNACRPPGEWQTYDIIFRAPRFHADGELKAPGALTVLHNGVLVQNDYELQGVTDFMIPPTYMAHPLREPLALQFHGNPVRFRNIWIRDLLTPADELSTSTAETSVKTNDGK
ncbi:MAG: DUF1080 domain-containing protein [Planctomycetaceae bacterium]|nr:DUF1080 domain-containing protein [Planctomycetaceae bacterium]